MEALKSLGGVSGLASALASDSHRGLDPNASGAGSIDAHKEAFGANKFKETPAKSFWVLMWENLQDPIIILLCAAALVSRGKGVDAARLPVLGAPRRHPGIVDRGQQPAARLPAAPPGAQGTAP